MSFSLTGAQLSFDRDNEQVSHFSLLIAGLFRQAGLSIFLKGLILAQNERWRRGLGMQVEREVCC